MHSPIKCVLIANRSEIACRVIRTCKRLGVRTIAIYSTADANSLHVVSADESVGVGQPESKESYLNAPRIIEVAKNTGADAIHPGYGFLSENSSFVEEVEKAGIHFIGPSSKSMRLVGDKVKAKDLAKDLNIPIAPSLIIDQKNEKQAKDFATKVGFPILIKAAAGGGGRGMRRLDSLETFEEVLASASREAQAFFGDGKVFLEKFITHARHIEVQVLGDKYGNVLAISDRDCSLQRSHQKVIEEAPAPGLPAKLRNALHEAAVRLCEKAQYIGAGTVEFLVDGTHNFYFLEVNSRLQVEHPVTELITDLDLVELQIRIAEGVNLRDYLNLSSGENIIPKRVAIECRLCAESPEEGFISSGGLLEEFKLLPDVFSTGTLRVDTGYRKGDVITHYYDSLLAKIIVASSSREKALETIRAVLREVVVSGVKTNINFLYRLISSTEFIELRHHIYFAPKVLPSKEELRKELQLGLCLYMIWTALSKVRETNDAWSSCFGFRLLGEARFMMQAEAYGEEVTGEVLVISRDHFQANVGELWENLEIRAVEDERMEVVSQGFHQEVMIKSINSRILVRTEKWLHEIFIPSKSHTHSCEGRGATKEEVSSPLPGKVLELKVEKGTQVTEGQVLLVIESMKMEHLIKAPHAGEVKEIMVKKSEIVEAKVPLLILTPI